MNTSGCHCYRSGLVGISVIGVLVGVTVIGVN